MNQPETEFLDTIFSSFAQVLSSDCALYAIAMSAQDSHEFMRFLARHGLAHPIVFPQACGHRSVPNLQLKITMDILEEHLAAPSGDGKWLPRILAAAFLRDGDLADNLGLPGKATLDRIFKEYFPGLYALNIDGRPWKEFLHFRITDKCYFNLLKTVGGCQAFEELADCMDPEF